MPKQPPEKSTLFNKIFNRNKYEDAQVNQDSHYDDQKKILQYFTSLAENHPDLILIFSPEGKLVSQNSNSINELLGYSVRVNLNFKELVTEQTYSTLGSAFRDALKGKSRKHEVDFIKDQGDTLYLVITFIPIKSGARVEGVYLIVEDITEQKQLKQQVEVHAKHLNHAQQIAKAGSWEYIIEDDSLHCNDYFYDIIGLKNNGKMLKEKIVKLVHPDDLDMLQGIVEQGKSGEGFFIELRIYHGRTKKVKYLQVSAEVFWKQNKPYKLVGVIRDNTKNKELEIELKNNDKTLEHIFDHLNSGFWMKDYTTGKITYLSKGMEEILTIPLQRIYLDPFSWQSMILPEFHKDVMKKQKALEEGESINYKYQIQAGDGTLKWIYEQSIPWFNREGKLEKLYGVLVDITSEIGMQEQLNYLASYDALTELFNQQSLYEKLDNLCNSNQSFALYYIDLDRFNVVNDSLGYQVGDEVLINTANRLIAHFSEDDYIARLGSNDFVVIVTDFTDKRRLGSLAESTISRIEVPMDINEYELHVTTSIGISIFPEDGDNKLTLLENAHSALYHAKQQGRNNYQFYSNSRDLSSYKKYILEKDMRKAIVNEEFELYYQPQVDATNGVIYGAEALIRWNHQDWGLVSPGEFIPLAEESHLIHHISDWVIRKVCVQLRDWKDRGYTLKPISINISPIRFLKGGLVELVQEQLELFQIPARYLELEITEGSLLKSDKQVLATLEKLRELGIKIVIDDFGTGYASLDYLRNFDAAKIKIDQIFIQGINLNSKDTAIVSSILHLSKGLGIEIVAEGVEEFEQYEFLKQKECDLIQGYLFSKPVPIETYEQMLKTGFLKPKKRKNTKPDEERRNYYRFRFPNCIVGEMTVIQVEKKKVKLGSTPMLMEDISLGGLKIVSSLKLPVNTDMIFKFKFKLMKEIFEVEGTLQWKEEVKRGIYFYGIAFNITEQDEDRLAGVINRMSVLHNLNHPIPDTDFINEEPFVYLKKNAL